VERLFFFKNLKTAMPVSEAKGVILFTAAKNKIPVYEFTPLQVKMTVAGYGKAEKKQVQKMIRNLLDLEENPEDKDKKRDDAADALGVALCYAIHSESEKRLKSCLS
jgi:crossover junction endodeoxyribonuclease RuvC